MLGQIEHHKIEIRPHHTAPPPKKKHRGKCHFDQNPEKESYQFNQQLRNQIKSKPKTSKQKTEKIQATINNKK